MESQIHTEYETVFAIISGFYRHAERSFEPIASTALRVLGAYFLNDDTSLSSFVGIISTLIVVDRQTFVLFDYMPSFKQVISLIRAHAAPIRSPVDSLQPVAVKSVVLVLLDELMLCRPE